MSLIGKSVRIAFVGLALVATSPAAFAQEISPEQLALALDVVKSARASAGFDNVLPALANKVQDRLILVRPDLFKQIGDAVEAVALKLAARRNDLDNEVARIWAKSFTIDELKVLDQFYKSAAGQKFAEIGPRVVTDTYQAVGAWSNRVGDELLEKTKEELKSKGFDF